ncbi:Lysophospholipase L1 [Pedococcus dokdonensis]|uniref:Lysophospholipase L1 n=1 Tax=Pedococcus dokdonensis TaxID=443156 RepID=A0A1H0M6H6_9MICO|nr:Lysophospholipase L1 [Pedococcus dokdonensis]
MAAGLVALAVVTAVVGGGPSTRRTPSTAASVPSSSPAAVPTTSAAGPGPAPRSVVGLGDSVTAGTNCGCTPFVERFARLLAARDGGPVKATNLGVPGLTTGSLAAGLARAKTARAVASADVVVVTIGANDLAGLEDRWERSGCDTGCVAPGVASMGRGLASDLRRIRALGPAAQRVEVTTYWNVFEDGDVADATRGPGFAEWSDTVTVAANRAICSAARAAGDTCVDLYEPFLSADGSRNPTALLSADGDHPDAAGHALIARTLLAATHP